MSVFANGRSILHKGDGGVQTCPIPDVCKTPSPAGPVPVPYVNVGQDGDLDKGASKVKVEGQMPAVKGAVLSMSSGDEPGSAGGGVVSAKTKGTVSFATTSTDIKFEAKGVVRFLEVCLHNGNKVNTGGNAALGKPSVGLTYGEDSPCQVCGKKAGHKLESTRQSEAKAAEHYEKAPDGRANDDGSTSGYMMGSMVCRDPATNKQVTLRANSGRQPAGFETSPAQGFPDLQVQGRQPNRYIDATTVGGRRIRIHESEQDTNTIGNCAAPKLINAAVVLGVKPVAMTEYWRGPKNTNFKPGEHAESCLTCKRVLASMLCPEPEPNANRQKPYPVQ